MVRKKILKDQRGFTLLEILVGLGILLVMLTLSLQMLSMAANLAAANREELRQIYVGRAVLEVARVNRSLDNTDVTSFKVAGDEWLVSGCPKQKDLKAIVIATGGQIGVKVTTR